MRKVNLTVRARVMVPMILTYNVVAKADDGVPMERIARAAIHSKSTSGFDLEDSSFEVTSVEGVAPEDEAGDLDSQITDYVESPDSPTPKYLDHTVEDSR